MLLIPKIDWRGTISKAVVMMLVFFLATAAQDSSLNGTLFSAKTAPLSSLDALLEYYHLQNIHMYLALAITASCISFYGMAGGFHWYFYIKRRHKAEEWKCQPDSWLTLNNERHEIIMGSFNMLLGAISTGFISCYIMNGGKCSLYTSVTEVGWAYLFVSVFALFMYNEAAYYYLHRLLHYPYLYRKIHQVHHRYRSPTAFCALAMHPIEFMTYLVALVLPVFTIPLHAGVFATYLMYNFHYDMTAHSGIKIDALWPWQPSSMFHDDHHRYFHCNFGRNSLFFDNLHGTLRRKDRVYGEDVFGGKGKQVDPTDAK